ncbi:MAG TPA: copper chaperone PCu(A)C [Xanthobacteraceae bacterium]|jgi:periplasmic copper chaperone A|nr:copper chaperone PCu(A)C [Xanthobacteraceae bacterium]
MIRALALATAFVLAANTAHAHSIKAKALTIVHPWCIETEDTAKPVVVSMTIRNDGGKPDRLLRASTLEAAKAELRAGVPPDAEGDVIPAIAVNGRGEVNLKRGGPHILLTGVKKPLDARDSFLMTLTFARAGKVEVEVLVEEKSVLEPAKH